MMLEQLQSFKDIFSKKRLSDLSKLKEGNYIFDLQKSKKLLFKLTYSLFNRELEKLRRYFHKTLAKSQIQYSTSLAEARILFVPKKDSRSRLYIDYKGLNKVRIKSFYILLLITKTFNRLQSVKRQSKNNFKDTFYRLRIKRGNEQKIAFYTGYGQYRCIQLYYSGQ